MSDILCITNRFLCNEDFLVRIEKIASCNPKGIILREKDLSENEYKFLAKQVMDICHKYDTLCILHSFTNVAIELGSNAIHLPLNILRKMTLEEKKHFSIIGASCHSISELNEAAKLGCSYVTIGHIFDTDCKKGLPGQGTAFLKELCDSARPNANLLVYAIGGITPANCHEVLNCGAKGICIMSSIMSCKDVAKYISEFNAV